MKNNKEKREDLWIHGSNKESVSAKSYLLTEMSGSPGDKLQWDGVVLKVPRNNQTNKLQLKLLQSKCASESYEHIMLF